MSPERALPSFRYHPDPVSTGVFEPDSGAVCSCCGEQTSWDCVGPTYQEGPGPDSLCSWCIASGRAARELAVPFAAYTDTNYPLPPDAQESLIDFGLPAEELPHLVVDGSTAAFLFR